MHSISRSVVTVSIALAFPTMLFSPAYAGQIGPGVYKLVGGTGERTDICWRLQSQLDNGNWVENNDRNNAESGPQVISQSLGSSVENLTTDGHYIFVRRSGDGSVAARYRPVPCPPPPTQSVTINLGGGVVVTSSKTTVQSHIDKLDKNDPTTQAILFGEFDLGPWFVTGQVTFAGTPHGNLSDVFPAFPAANFTGTVNSGQLYGFVGDAGYTVYNSDGWKVGIFGGFYAYDEFDYGMFPGFAAQFPMLATQWRAGEGGVTIDKTFQVGAVPFDFKVTAAGQYDHLRAGMFNGNGGGVRINSMLSFPIGPVQGNIIAQYADLNASGSNTGVPLTFNTQTWYVGGGISYTFGGPPAASPASMVFKAPSK
jgi:hypothetical protein